MGINLHLVQAEPIKNTYTVASSHNIGNISLVTQFNWQ